MEVKILLYPVLKYDRKTDAEWMENSAYTNDELEFVIPDDVLIYSLSDFMDACNDAIGGDLSDYWLSYIRVNDALND